MLLSEPAERETLSGGAASPPPSRAASTTTARALSSLLDASWRARLFSRPPIDPDAMEAIAIGLEGAAPADGPWREALRVLTRALTAEAQLSPLGLTISHGQLVKLIRQRIRAEALWRAHPEILDRPVTAPVIIIGQMRSGTTRLHRLLACDPHFAHTRFFETMTPVAKPRAFDTRVLRARGALALMRALNPVTTSIHPTGPRDAEEEFGLTSVGFISAQFEAQWRVPSYARWCEAVDTGPLYSEFRRLIQTIGWARGDAPERAWLLKAPQFMQDLTGVLAAFPDARLLCLSRDPAAVVGSSASLVLQQMRVQSDAADRRWIGREWLHKTAHRARVAARVRAVNAQTPQIDIAFDAVTADWRREMARVYAFLGLALTPEVEARMAAYLARAKGSHGHRYSLEEFGLTSTNVRQALSATSA